MFESHHVSRHFEKRCKQSERQARKKWQQATARQRQASSLQEISYRACFKPQLPRFFIERLTQPGEVVYDPFMGRGTTVVEAAAPLPVSMLRTTSWPLALSESTFHRSPVTTCLYVWPTTIL